MTDEAVFNLVWLYNIKEVDNRKKARCTLDGSPCLGQVCVLDFTYASNCVDQTSARVFYAVSAAENLIIHGTDVSNVFAEAPALKQGFFIHPDKAFHDWWVNHKHRDPIAPSAVIIPVLLAMQGHPESPRLWEKHANKILWDIGLVGRRGTNQLRLLEQYLDFLVKHTTEIPPPTALVEVRPRLP